MIAAPTRPAILVVEDENIVAMDLVASLEHLGYPVAAVTGTGEDAVRLAEQHRPGLVLMDIHLRGQMDGIRAADEIQRTLVVPVVFLTAYSDEATLERARVTRPYGYVVKPFDDRELDVAIQIALERYRLEVEIRNAERRLDAILGSIGDAVIAVDAARRITFLNRSAEALLGWQSERAEGRPLSAVLVTTPRADGTFTLARGRESVPVELVESPVLDAAGRSTGFVVAVRDVTERLRAAEAHERELSERAARAAVEREHDRARLKSAVSLALSELVTPADVALALQKVAALLVEHLADGCFVHVEHQGQVVRVVDHHDDRRAAELGEILRRWPPDPAAPVGTLTVARSGRSELQEHVSDDLLVRAAHDPEHLRALRGLGVASWLSVPFRGGSGVGGAMSLYSARPDRRYGPADVDFTQVLADRIAVAIEKARLYFEAHEARAETERRFAAEQRARAQAATLFRIADAISEARLDLDAILQRVTDEATALVGAAYGAFFYDVEDGRGGTYQLHTLSGAPKEAFEHLWTFTGTGVVRLDDVRTDPRYQRTEPHHGMPEGPWPAVSCLAVPVVARSGNAVGGLLFGHPEPARFEEHHERLVKALAAHASVAIDNARLFAATREAEAKQATLVKELERSVRFSDMFVGILGHDLRNPLSAITSGVTVILRRAGTDQIIDPAKRVLNSARRMARMIDQILDFTRVRIGRGIPLERKSLDLAALCRAAIEELNQDGNAGNIEVVPRGEPVGQWDEDRLSQLVSNLAGNALQHRTPGTPVALVVDGTSRDHVVLEVHNRGVIPEELRRSLFEPFQGGSAARGSGASGLGLGLYISQQIVLAHGGSIRVESHEEAGTRFVVDLPRAPPPATAGHLFTPDVDGAR